MGYYILVTYVCKALAVTLGAQWSGRTTAVRGRSSDVIGAVTLRQAHHRLVVVTGDRKDVRNRMGGQSNKYALLYFVRYSIRISMFTVVHLP